MPCYRRHDAGTLHHALICSLETEHVRARPEACQLPNLCSRSVPFAVKQRRLRQGPVSATKPASGIARSVFSANQRRKKRLGTVGHALKGSVPPLVCICSCATSNLNRLFQCQWFFLWNHSFYQTLSDTSDTLVRGCTTKHSGFDG
jgi:hypothetical protein